MNLKLLPTLLLLCAYTFVYTQEQASIWYFGDNAGIDFKTGSPEAITDGQIVTHEGCATISDENGSLLFYTDGVSVWDKNHSIMPNGYELEGDSSSSQSAIIVPNPYNFNQYFIFTVRAISHRGGLHYSMVDLSLNDNNGDVVTNQKNIKLLNRSAEKIAAIEDNENGYWVLSYSGDTGEESVYDTFHAYRINSDGINPSVKTKFTACATTDGRGYLKIAADATKVILCSQNQKHVSLHNFDVETGKLYGDTSLTVDRPVYCAEFSLSTDKVYVSTGSLFNSTSILYQFDLKSFDIQNSRTEIYREYSRRAALQLGLDGKIYYARPSKTYIGVINNPEESGANCNYLNEGVDLKGKYCNQGLPPFIQSYLLGGINAKDTCHGNAVEFSLDSSVSKDSVVWNFGDGNTSTEENPTHLYDFPGIYQVTTSIIAGSSSRLLKKEVKVIEVPKGITPIDYLLCDDASLDGIEVFDLSEKNQEILGGLSNTDYEVTYYTSIEDAINNTNLLPDNYSNTTKNQEIIAKVYHLNYRECYSIVSFLLTVETPPVANTVKSIIVCDDAANDGSEIIDLTQFNTSVLDTQLPSNHLITYYLTQDDANNGVGALPENFQTISNPQAIYVRIENSNNSKCYDTTSFKIKIGGYIAISEPSDFYLCDDSIHDGLTSFDLSIKAKEILGAFTISDYQVNFYANMQDALSNTNLLPINYENINNNQEIIAKIFSPVEEDCFKTVRFSLIVETPAIANTVENISVCDDSSNDGIEIVDLSQFNISVLNNQIASNNKITYHLTQNDANNGVGALPENFQTISNPQAIYVRIENSNNSKCYDTTSFKIKIGGYIAISEPSDFYLCDDSIHDGLTSFDLSIKAKEILGTFPISDYQVNFYANMQDALSNTNLLPINYENINNNQEIIAKIFSAVEEDCFKTVRFLLIVETPAIANAVENISICDDSSNDGIEIVDLSQFNISVLNNQIASNNKITYHLTQDDANNGVGALPENFQTQSNFQLIYARIENNTITRCYDTTQFEIAITKKIEINQIGSLYVCDDVSNDGIETFDLTVHDAVILNEITGNYSVSYFESEEEAITNSNRINDLYSTTENIQELFFRVENGDNINCYSIGSFFIEVIAYENLIMKDIWYKCASNPLTLIADAGYDEYLWSNGETTQEISVDASGKYEVIVTKYHPNTQGSYCSYSKTVKVVESTMASIINIEVKDWTQNNNGFIVTTNGIGDYEYSLDGNTYQDSNVFENLRIGDYTVFVRDKKGCGIIKETVYVLFYPKFFTPNGDGYNDNWQLYFSNSEPDIEIFIFDRFGKLIKQLDPRSKGWDGTLNGVSSLTTDYWFTVNRPSKNKQYKGHFTLKR